MSLIVYHQIAGLIQHGIAHGVWEDRHLAAFADRIRKQPPEVTFVSAIEGELTSFADSLRQMLAGKRDADMNGFDFSNLDIDDFDDLGDTLRELWGSSRPRGKAILDMVNAVEWLYRKGMLIEGARRTTFHFHDLEEFTRKEESIEDEEDRMQEMSAMVLKFSATRYFEVKTTHALLRTGIALERHRLAHGGHPEALAALVPEFLTEVPLDPCDGQPLRYRLQSDGSPVVWSIGIDGIDEGGKPHRNREKGDRVWLTKPLEGFDERELSR